MSKFIRITRLATMPETRGALTALVRSGAVGTLARRARSDRAALLRSARDPVAAMRLARSAAEHPATRELAEAGMLFLPGRLGPLGWAAIWVGRRARRRVIHRAATRPSPSSRAR